MTAKRSLLLVVLALCSAGIACDLPALNSGSNQAPADQGSGADPRAAPTFPPTYTPTPTLLPTNTPEPSEPDQSAPGVTPTQTSTPPPPGWLSHGAYGFHIILPERWSVIEEQFAGDVVKFEAVDSEPAGGYSANVYVLFQYQYSTFTIEELCELLPANFESWGYKLLNTDCGMDINGLPAGRFTFQFQFGSVSVKEYMYFFADNTRIWLVELSVDEIAWSRYKSTFITIGESFVLD